MSLSNNNRIFPLSCAAFSSPWWSLSSMRWAKRRNWTNSWISQAGELILYWSQCRVSSCWYPDEDNPWNRKSRCTVAYCESPEFRDLSNPKVEWDVFCIVRNFYNSHRLSRPHGWETGSRYTLRRKRQASIA